MQAEFSLSQVLLNASNASPRGVRGCGFTGRFRRGGKGLVFGMASDVEDFPVVAKLSALVALSGVEDLSAFREASIVGEISAVEDLSGCMQVSALGGLSAAKDFAGS